MTARVIGREKEQSILQELLLSEEAEFVALYGRRRVGKTFLVETVYKKEIVFSITGLNKTGKDLQLENFMNVLNSKLSGTAQIPTRPKTWLKAFYILQQYLEGLKRKHKMVVFIDELPWLATSKSGFLSALENFWNSWASKRANIIVLVCGSAASWMISNIIKSRGGLHNRITKRIRLLPFNLYETEAYLKSRNIQLERYDLLQLYMVMGGIPHYLKEVKRGKSATQIIDEVCFSKDGLLRDEFINLYEGLFNKAERYINVIKALAKKPNGLTRKELIQATKLSSGGTTSKIFDSLEESGFIVKYLPIGKNLKLALYKLSDPYSAFYLKFIANSRASGTGSWIKKSEQSTWKSWSGFAFERLCLAHIPQIKAALGISGIYTEESSWRKAGTEGNMGSQIDLVIDRGDNVINICEIKFSQYPFVINKNYADELRTKLTIFKQSTKFTKSLFLTMITTFGLVENKYSTSLIQQSIDMDALFKEESKS
ncbi:MAG: ATP-binding protein [Chitinophagales bacterium]